MAEVKILIQGYAREEGEKEFASSTATLIKEGELNIIVDPGMNKDLLIDTLAKEGLKPEDIDFVVLTHTHLDHCLLAGMFSNAKFVDGSSIYSLDGSIEEHEGKIPGTDIEIIETPGHDQFHCSVIVNTEDLGKIVVAGDVFWWADDEEQEKDKDDLINHKDLYVKNEDQLKESREKILELADYIIPGHGPMYKVEK